MIVHETLRPSRRATAAGLALLASITLSSAAQAASVRIGYWSSGVSLGFGAVLEAGKFMEKEGLDVTYVKFPDVNAPTKAMAANAIDFAIGASAGTAFSVATDGLPISIMLSTQVADLDFVVPEASPLKSLADFKGKKIGGLAAGSAAVRRRRSPPRSSIGTTASSPMITNPSRATMRVSHNSSSRRTSMPRHSGR